MFSSGKAVGKTVSGIIGTLSVVVSFVVTLYFFLQINQTKQAYSNLDLFDWIQISNFKVRFWISIRSIVSSLVAVCNRNWFFDSLILHQLYA